MIYILSYIIGWVVGELFYQSDQSLSLIEALTMGHLVFTVGFFGLFNFVGHTIVRQRVARSIGWVSNGFQLELGFVSLGIGIAGILCYWFRDGFWFATAIPFSVFLVGAGCLHIAEMIRKRNFNTGNAWIIIPDFLMPVTLIVLLAIR